jgi:hypothetical protein
MQRLQQVKDLVFINFYLSFNGLYRIINKTEPVTSGENLRNDQPQTLKQKKKKDMYNELSSKMRESFAWR